MGNIIKNTTLTFTSGQIVRIKREQGANGIVLKVHGDNLGMTFEVATCPAGFEFTAGSTTAAPNTAQFNDNEVNNGAVFSSTNPFDADYAWATDIIVRALSAGKINVQEID